MFGFGFLEILVLVLVAFLVLGPDKFPSVARDFLKIFNELKRSFSDVSDEIKDIHSDISDLSKQGQEAFFEEKRKLTKSLIQPIKKIQEEIISETSFNNKTSDNKTTSEDSYE